MESRAQSIKPICWKSRCMLTLCWTSLSSKMFCRSSWWAELLAHAAVDHITQHLSIEMGITFLTIYQRRIPNNVMTVRSIWLCETMIKKVQSKKGWRFTNRRLLRFWTFSGRMKQLMLLTLNQKEELVISLRSKLSFSLVSVSMLKWKCEYPYDNKFLST